MSFSIKKGFNPMRYRQRQVFGSVKTSAKTTSVKTSVNAFEALQEDDNFKEAFLKDNPKIINTFYLAQLQVGTYHPLVYCLYMYDPFVEYILGNVLNGNEKVKLPKIIEWICKQLKTPRFDLELNVGKLSNIEGFTKFLEKHPLFKKYHDELVGKGATTTTSFADTIALMIIAKSSIVDKEFSLEFASKYEQQYFDDKAVERFEKKISEFK